MGMIRGKIEAPRELRPRTIWVGKQLAYEKDGKWYDIKTNEELLVQDFFEVFPEALEK